MGKWSHNWKKYLKSYILWVLAAGLALPLGKVGATITQTVYDYVSPTATIVQNVYEEPPVGETNLALENKIANNLVTQRSHKFQEQVVYGKWFAFVDADTKELDLYHLGNGELRVVSTSPANKRNLDMHWDYLVWEEEGDIWINSFKDGRTEKLTNTPEFYETSPRIYGSRVAYWGERDIYLYDIDSKQTTNLTQHSNAWRSPPSIRRDIVAWSDDSDGAQNVYIYDLNQLTKTKITNYTTKKWLDYPVLTQNWLVYPFVDDNGVRQLMAYKLKTGESRQLPDIQRGKFRLTADKFDNNTLIWNRADDRVIFYDLDKDQLTELGVMEQPTIYGQQAFGIEKGDNRKINIR